MAATFRSFCISDEEQEHVPGPTPGLHLKLVSSLLGVIKKVTVTDTGATFVLDLT